MATRKIKIGKIAIVVFLTVLIWVWADLAQDKNMTVYNVVVRITPDTGGFWAGFGENGEQAASLETVVLRGQASRINELERKKNKGLLDIEVFLNLQKEGIINAGRHTLNVLDFLRKSGEIRELGVSVDDCKPAQLTITAVKLVKKTLVVKCYDDAGNLLTPEQITPETVTAEVPENWSRDKLTARVRLHSQDVDNAKKQAISKTAYVEFSATDKRDVPQPIRIKMPLEENSLREFHITAKLSVAMSPDMLGKYDVVIKNLNQVISNITVRATDVAAERYSTQSISQITLHVFEDDAKKAGVLKRKAVYNLPLEYVRKGEILPPDSPVPVEFEVVPKTAAGTAKTE